MNRVLPGIPMFKSKSSLISLIQSQKDQPGPSKWTKISGSSSCSKSFRGGQDSARRFLPNLSKILSRVKAGWDLVREWFWDGQWISISINGCQWLKNKNQKLVVIHLDSYIFLLRVRSKCGTDRAPQAQVQDPTKLSYASGFGTTLKIIKIKSAPFPSKSNASLWQVAQVMSARAVYEQSFPGDPFAWKRQAFKEAKTCQLFFWKAHSFEGLAETCRIIKLKHPPMIWITPSLLVCGWWLRGLINTFSGRNEWIHAVPRSHS